MTGIITALHTHFCIIFSHINVLGILVLIIAIPISNKSIAKTANRSVIFQD